MLSSCLGKFPLAIAQLNAARLKSLEETKKLFQDEINKRHAALSLLHSEKACYLHPGVMKSPFSAHCKQQSDTKVVCSWREMEKKWRLFSCGLHVRYSRTPCPDASPAQPQSAPGCQSSVFSGIENGSYRLCQA